MSALVGKSLIDLLLHLKPKNFSGTDETGAALSVTRFKSGLAAPSLWVEFDFTTAGDPAPHVLRAERFLSERHGKAIVTLDGQEMANGHLSVALHVHFFSVTAEVVVSSDDRSFDFTAKAVGF